MREAIPQGLAADTLYLSDRTCCVCNEAGRPVQIHHIDGDHSNNTRENFAVLCLLCHNETEVRGGFGRHLTPPVVTKCIEEWLARVVSRRARADELAVAYSVELMAATDTQRLAQFIQRIPYMRFEALRTVQPRWDSGTTSEMLQGSYDYVAVLGTILRRLTAHFPKNQFGSDGTEAFISSWTSMLFQWHRARLEPEGLGTGGTMVGVMAGGSVIADLERMIQELVFGMGWERDEKQLALWRKRWNRRPKTG